jgi:hypothetical protein
VANPAKLAAVTSVEKFASATRLPVIVRLWSNSRGAATRAETALEVRRRPKQEAMIFMVNY